MWFDLAWDAALVYGFGLQHSLFATIRSKGVVKRWITLDSLSWRGPQSFLNVLYVVLAASMWRPVDLVLWEFTGAAYWICLAVLAFGWVWYFQIHIFEYDCGLAFGSTAVTNRILGRSSPPLELWKTGTRRWIRFPVHTAFFPMFLAFPVMRADLLVLGIAANVYNVVGTILYDVRLKKLAGETYHRYVDRTGLIWPPVYRNRKGAEDMELPEPTHWSRPFNNLGGIMLGIVGGFVYWQLLGVTQAEPGQLWIAWGASALWALIAGFLLTLISARSLRDVLAASFDRFQTQVSTNAALISAVSLFSWFAISIVRVGAHPTLAIVLPMWITVLWVAHATAILLLNAAKVPVSSAQAES